MKFNLLVLLAVFVIAITLLNSGSAEYGEYTSCPPGCQGCESNKKPIVMCEKTKTEECNKECYRACGFRTTCRSDKATATSGVCDTNNCESECNEWCGSLYSYDECKKACKSTCEMNGQIYPLVEIVYGIAAGIAALMIILHGFKWLISEEPAERKEARERIIYTLYGVIIIIIAVALVNTIYSASISRCA